MMGGDGGDASPRPHPPEPRGAVIRNNVLGMNHRRARQRLQRQPPKIRMAVQDIEPSGLFDRPTEIDPLAEVPVVRRTRFRVRTRKRRHQLAFGFGAGDAKNRDLVAHLLQVPRQQPDERFHAPTAGTADGGGDRRHLGNAHINSWQRPGRASKLFPPRTPVPPVFSRRGSAAGSPSRFHEHQPPPPPSRET